MSLTYEQINSLGEVSFIGGTAYTFVFNVYNQNGTPANLSGSTCSWKMSPYGSPDMVVLNYSGNITGTNTFEVTIPSGDTVSLSGKFIHQPIIVDGGEDYRSEQGIINIIPAIN